MNLRPPGPQPADNPAICVSSVPIVPAVPALGRPEQLWTHRSVPGAVPQGKLDHDAQAPACCARADPSQLGWDRSAVGDGRDAAAARRRRADGERRELAREGRQFLGQALGVAARADVREEAVRFAELALTLLLVAVLARQFG